MRAAMPSSARFRQRQEDQLLVADASPAPGRRPPGCVSSAAFTIFSSTSSSLPASSLSSSTGRAQWPLPVASSRTWLRPAQARRIESCGMPIFCAIWSAVLKPMPWMSFARQYGSRLDLLDGVLAVGLVDAHGPAGADAVGVQEHHDVADDLLLRPGFLDALRGAWGRCRPRPPAGRTPAR